MRAGGVFGGAGKGEEDEEAVDIGEKRKKNKFSRFFAFESLRGGRREGPRLSKEKEGF